MPASIRRSRVIALLLAGLTLAVVAIGFSPSSSAAPVGWHEGRHTHRIIVTVTNDATPKVDALVEVGFPTNPANLLPETVRVTEVSSTDPTTNVEVEADVPVQVDGGDTVVFMIDGALGANETRFFHVYFGSDRAQSPGFIDTTAAATKRAVSVTLLSATAAGNPYGVAMYEIETRAGTWYFDPNGGGFAGLVDADDNDWIGWDPDLPDEGGEFRGIPKARLDTAEYGNDEGPFSPGSNDTLSNIVDQGPVRVTFRSQSRDFADLSVDGNWVAEFAVGPRSMTFEMTTAQSGVEWRSLYQGEPGGSLTNADQIILSGQNGNAPTQLNLTNFSGASLGSPEWAAFLDGPTTRSLVVSATTNPEVDLATSRTTAEGSTTIFGFGRASSAQNSHELTGTGDVFTYGLVDSKTSGTLEARANDFRAGAIGDGGGTATAAAIEVNTDVDTPDDAPEATTTTVITTPDTIPPLPLSGYRLLDQRGDVYVFGEATFLGEARGDNALPGTPVDIESTPSNRGYWIIDDQGNIRAFGDATNALGGVTTALDPGETVSTMSATPTGGGYWIFTTKGRVLTFGDAGDFQDLFDITDANGNVIANILNGPIVDSVATPSGNGYWMVGSDGGVFTFGDAQFFGSMGSTPLNQPVNGLVPDPDNVGYWLVAGDGGVFAFDAEFRGSMGSIPLNRPVVGMVSYGNGYLMVGADGGVFNFSDLPFDGSLGDNPPTVPVVAITA
ncbi:MAG: hypothetical protein AAGA99_05225 [Actinomycetota bacterium]